MSALQRHYNAVADLGCIVCRQMNLGPTQAQIHHPWGRKNGNERKVLPLCYTHHQAGVNNKFIVSVHPWTREFEKRYGTQAELLKQVDELLRRVA